MITELEFYQLKSNHEFNCGRLQLNTQCESSFDQKFDIKDCFSWLALFRFYPRKMFVVHLSARFACVCGRAAALAARGRKALQVSRASFCFSFSCHLPGWLANKATGQKTRQQIGPRTKIASPVRTLKNNSLRPRRAALMAVTTK